PPTFCAALTSSPSPCAIPPPITPPPSPYTTPFRSTIAGVPAGASLSAGTDNGDGSWTLAPGQLAGLSITPPANYSGSFNLSVTATSVDGASSATTSATLSAAVTCVADAPTLHVATA